jgi:molybdopterin molybdotransferase
MSKKPGRREWLRANLQPGADGQMWVHKFPHQGSGVLTSMVASDGLVELPEDLDSVTEGQLVDFLPFSEMTQ